MNAYWTGTATSHVYEMRRPRRTEPFVRLCVLRAFVLQLARDRSQASASFPTGPVAPCGVGHQDCDVRNVTHSPECVHMMAACVTGMSRVRDSR